MFNYIGDFFSKDLKLFVELDGATHFEKAVRAKDRKKQAEIESHGYTLLRFKDEEVAEELEKVRNEIVSWIKDYEAKHPEVLEKKKKKAK
jgi:very-short-patch-repair endonuclease